MRPHRKASGTARGEDLRGPAPLDSPPAAKAEPWNHHAAMTSPQGSPRPHGPRETDGTGAPASAPRIPNHQLSEWCERMMKGSLAHAGHETDKDKVLNASRMLVDIVDTVEDTDLKLQVQPLAIISYILWWMGDGRAMLTAMRALAIDEECSLAAIVAAAIHGDLWPNRN